MTQNNTSTLSSNYNPRGSQPEILTPKEIEDIIISYIVEAKLYSECECWTEAKHNMEKATQLINRM